jgi:hypothetical protein
MKNGQSNGHRNGQHSGKVRVAIVGVGNCASSFVQGVHYYRDASSLRSMSTRRRSVSTSRRRSSPAPTTP